MAEDQIDINLSDPEDIGLQKFTNLVDPQNLDRYVKRIKDPHEKKSIEELTDALLEGTI